MMDYIAIIDAIAQVTHNWNGNGAKPFSPDIIASAKSFLSAVEYNQILGISPTGRDSIQFEWEFAGVYCEAEVYAANIEMYVERNGHEFYNFKTDEISLAASEFNWIYDNIAMLYEIEIPRWHEPWAEYENVQEPSILCKHHTQRFASKLFEKYGLYVDNVKPSIAGAYMLVYRNVESNNTLKIEVYNDHEVAGIVFNTDWIDNIAVDIVTETDIEILVNAFLNK